MQNVPARRALGPRLPARPRAFSFSPARRYPSDSACSRTGVYATRASPWLPCAELKQNALILLFGLIFKIIRVGFFHLAALVRLGHFKAKPVLLGIGNGGVLGFKGEAHFTRGVAHAG